jgi:CBS domain containing-hemolysin-like protein
VAINLIIIAGLLIIAFVLSASEVALYSLTGLRETLKGRVSSRLFKSPQLLLSTILVSNAVAIFLFSFLGASFVMDLASRYAINKTAAVIVEVVVFSGLLILFADTVPKIVASRRPRLVARATLPFLAVLLFIESPIVFPLNSFLTRINRKRKKSQLTIDNEGLKTLSEVAATAGVIEENEAQLLRKIAFLGEKTVKNAMTPRAEITSVSIDSKFNEVLKILKRCEHSRLPVYLGTPDNVVGMLYARDFLRVFRRERSRPDGASGSRLKGNGGVKFQVNTLMRKPVFVPETQSLERLIETFRENKVRIVVAVDEFGDLAGIVTLSDVVREIFGSSAEEPKQGSRIIKLSDSSFAVKGNARLDEIEAAMSEWIPSGEGFDIGEKSGETISSLLTEMYGHVPRLGSRIAIGNFEFEVEQATPKNVLQVKAHRLNSVPADRDE